MRNLSEDWTEVLQSEAARDKRDMRDEAAVLIVEALRARQLTAERRPQRDQRLVAAS